MTWWTWLLIGLLLIAIEFVRATMRVGLLAAGAFFVALLVLFGVRLPVWAELIVFASVSALASLFIRPIIVRKLAIDKNSVVDSMIGKEAVALEDISAGGSGKAELRGGTWTARNVGETALIRGQRCVVEAVDGLVIHVRAS